MLRELLGTVQQQGTYKVAGVIPSATCDRHFRLGHDGRLYESRYMLGGR